MFCFITSSLIWSQDLYVGATGVVRITPTAFVYAKAEVKIEDGGDVTIDSDEKNSASFLAPNTSTGVAIGDITYKRYIADNKWHLVSAPVANQKIGTFVGENKSVVDYNENNGNHAVAYYKNTNNPGKRWTYHNTTTSGENKENLTDIHFIAGQGYSMMKTAAGYYTFTGAMANDDVRIPTTSTSGTHLWTAIGNPFPSFLDVSEILSGNVNKLDAAFATLYVWNTTLNSNSGGYAIESSTSSLQLAPGQAFMVRAKSINETFVFSKASQKHKSGLAAFLRPSTATPTISVHLTNGTANKSTNLEFLDSATKGLDVGYDAGAYQDGTPSFSINTHLVSDSQGIDFTRQSLPIRVLDSGVAIPLSINAGINEEVTFSADTKNLPDGVSVYLEDTLNNTFTNLTAAPLELKITEALSGIGRFYLRTSSGVLSTETNLVGASIAVYKTSNGTVKITGLSSGSTATFSMFTILGKEVLATKFIAQNVKEIVLPASLSTGVYIVGVVSDLGTFHKKIIIE
jgi:hypothetical protein